MGFPSCTKSDKPGIFNRARPSTLATDGSSKEYRTTTCVLSLSLVPFPTPAVAERPHLTGAAVARQKRNANHFLPPNKPKGLRISINKLHLHFPPAGLVLYSINSVMYSFFHGITGWTGNAPLRIADCGLRNPKSQVSCYPVKIAPFAQHYTSPYLRMRLFSLAGGQRLLRVAESPAPAAHVQPVPPLSALAWRGDSSHPHTSCSV